MFSRYYHEQKKGTFFIFFLEARFWLAPLNVFVERRPREQVLFWGLYNGFMDLRDFRSDFRDFKDFRPDFRDFKNLGRN